MTRLLRFILVLLFLEYENHLAASFVICNGKKLAYFHVPKCGGSSISAFLERLPGSICQRLGWGITTAYIDKKNNEPIKYDAAHVTPAELQEYIFLGVGKFQHWGNKEAGMDAATVVGDFHKFATIRNPYMRVLSAFDQRRMPGYRVWGDDYPKEFEPFMQWLETGLQDTPHSLAWCCTPTITHFRPSTMFTHWPDKTPVSQMEVIKFEEMAERLPMFLKKMNITVSDIPFNNKKGQTGIRANICSRPSGCSDLGDLELLLSMTPHTNETIRIVNKIYARDFELLGYSKLLSDIGEIMPAHTKINEIHWHIRHSFTQSTAWSLLALGILVTMAIKNRFRRRGMVMFFLIFTYAILCG